MPRWTFISNSTYHVSIFIFEYLTAGISYLEKEEVRVLLRQVGFSVLVIILKLRAYGSHRELSFGIKLSFRLDLNKVLWINSLFVFVLVTLLKHYVFI